MKKLVCVLFITLALPVFGALSTHSRREAQAFNAVAVAGHTTFGGGPSEWCQPCGCPKSGCACDPGEEPGPCGDAPAQAPLTAESGDSGAGLLLVLFALGFAVRFASRQ